MRRTQFLGIALAFILVVSLVQCRSWQRDEGGDVKDASSITYHNTVKPIAQAYCTTCHGGSTPAAGLLLNNFEDFRNATSEGELLKRINDHKNPMPQSGLLPKQYRWMIAQWAKNGYPLGVDSSPSIGKADTSVNDGTLRSNVVPVSIEKAGLGLLDSMQGHWIGSMNIMGQKYPWFAWDYRAISSSAVHGIFEGGSMGNLFNTFFVTDFNGERTITARNGGLLNGIYRTSYFVLDSVEIGSKEHFYRLVDAYGGADIMWMELRFKWGKLNFKSYTSRMGLDGKPSIHMTFNAKRFPMQATQDAQGLHKFPINEMEWSLAQGLPKPNWGPENPVISSASYLSEIKGADLETLADSSRDPITIKDYHTSEFTVDVYRHSGIKTTKLLLYLSHKPLTDENGKLKLQGRSVEWDLFNSVLSFPELEAPDDKFTFTYLHPGEYFLTVVADLDKNGYPSAGDLSHKSESIEVKPDGVHKINIVGMVKN